MKIYLFKILIILYQKKINRIIDFINNAKPNFKRFGSRTRTDMSKLENLFLLRQISFE